MVNIGRTDRSGTESRGCRVLKRSHGNWETICLCNGVIELCVAPEIGGRIIQLWLGDEEYFYVNSRHFGRVYPPEENNQRSGWKNYGGSKVWPAPQGWSCKEEWPGPPDPVLDGGPYRCDVLEDRPETAALLLRSAPDPSTGLILSREIRIFDRDSTIRIRNSMQNMAACAVEWSIWQVTQQMAGDSTKVIVPATSWRQIYGDMPYTQIESEPDAALLRIRYENRVAKLGVKPEAGWLLTIDPSRSLALAETFPLFPTLPYPDDAPIQIWVNGQGTYTLPAGRVDASADPNGCDAYVETEVLSPLVRLLPRQSYTFQIWWYPLRIKKEEECLWLLSGLTASEVKKF